MRGENTADAPGLLFLVAPAMVITRFLYESGVAAWAPPVGDAPLAFVGLFRAGKPSLDARKVKDGVADGARPDWTVASDVIHANGTIVVVIVNVFVDSLPQLRGS